MDGHADFMGVNNMMNIKDLDPETVKKLGLLDEYKSDTKKPGNKRFTKDQVRSHAFRVLSVIAALSQNERARVLNHADRLNSL